MFFSSNSHVQDGMRLGEDLESYFILRCRGNREKNKGNEWSDGMGGQVKQICIWYDDLIYGIQVSYERNGNIFHSPRHGGNEGNFEQVKSLSQFEEVN